MTGFYMVMGEYDLVTIIEAPNDGLHECRPGYRLRRSGADNLAKGVQRGGISAHHRCYAVKTQALRPAPP